MTKHIIYNVSGFAQPKSSLCWWTALHMVWAYWQKMTNRHGPMNILASYFDNNLPITPWELSRVAKLAGMRELPLPQSYTSDELRSLLVAHGPICVSGNWYGWGHAIVLTGISGEIVHFNDPNGGKKKTDTISWFRAGLERMPAAGLLVKDPAAY